MAMRFGVAREAMPAPVEEARVLESSASTDAEVAFAGRQNEALRVIVEDVVSANPPRYLPPAESLPDMDAEPEPELTVEHDDSHDDHGHADQLTGAEKLDRLVADDFPFDPSQIEFIDGIAGQRFACGTGAAGTGKTTCTKAIVERIKDDLGEVDMTDYFKRGTATDDPDDDYEIPEDKIPAIALVGFTGRSTQMIKKNFPRSWHGNIMTIHRMLAFYPEYYEDYNEEGELVNKMRFVPAYTADMKLPWDVIIIDEAGMVSIDLWELIHAAMKQGCRVIMIGDINQLPPVHGRSIFGFAMTEWPSFELTHIHRQEGANNSIVDNAHRILQGKMPVSDVEGLTLVGEGLTLKNNMLAALNTIVNDSSWKFLMVKVPEEAPAAAQRIRKVMELLKGKTYDPMRDSIITAINGEEPTSRGYNLGQLPMNSELAIVLNKGAPRFIIDAGRERKHFAVGDKVMATKNDHQAGITNGMTGLIVSIERNGAYAGEHARFGLVADVNAYMASLPVEDDDDFSLEEVSDSLDAQEKGRQLSKEGRDRGPASHIVTVQFGEGTHAFEIHFGSLSEVASLMTAYVVTCHKMQGGESPLVCVIVHQSYKSMLYREWAYTGVTRASQRCIVFYTDLGMRVAINKQKIKGVTLKEKINEFAKAAAVGILGAAVKFTLPVAESLATGLRPVSLGNLRLNTAPTLPAKPAGPSLLERLAAQRKAKVEAKPAPSPERIIIIERIRMVESELEAAPVAPVDGGDLTPHKPEPVQIPKLMHYQMQPTTLGKYLESQPAMLALPDLRTIDYTESFFPQEPMPMPVDHTARTVEALREYGAANPPAPLPPRPAPVALAPVNARPARFGVK